MLERYAVKVARTVLRGGSGSNATPLPDQGMKSKKKKIDPRTENNPDVRFFFHPAPSIPQRETALTGPALVSQNEVVAERENADLYSMCWSSGRNVPELLSHWRATEDNLDRLRSASSYTLFPFCEMFQITITMAT